jgi:hypothetical protein
MIIILLFQDILIIQEEIKLKIFLFINFLPEIQI